MGIDTEKEPDEAIEERVKEGTTQETDVYKYLGMAINKSGNFEDHILDLYRKCEVTDREISAIGAKHQVGKKKLCQACQHCYMGLKHGENR